MEAFIIKFDGEKAEHLISFFSYTGILGLVHYCGIFLVFGLLQ